MPSKRRVATFCGVAGVLLGAGVAGGVAQASGGAQPSSSTAAPASTSTATVERTNLISTVQVGGSIGFSGSYTLVKPQGSSPQQVTQAQQQVQQAETNLSNDEANVSASNAQAAQAVTNAQDAVDSAQAQLSADEATEATACAGRGAATPACSQIKQKVSQDQSQLNHANQSLTSAEDQAASTSRQNQQKLSQDQTQLQNAESSLAQMENNEAADGSTFTSLPSVGQIIKQGQVIYEVDGKPSVLLYGTVPFWRTFRSGMSDGPDVGQLNSDLIALGFGAGLTPSNHFSAATAAAIERWQASLGLDQTGVVLLGQAFFEPGAIRVTSVTPSVGQGAGPGPLLQASSTNRVVTVPLSVTQEYLVHKGDAVSVVLPDGRSTVSGHVQSVSDVAQCPGGGGSGNGSGALDCNNSSGNGTQSPTVNVTISLDDPAASGALDQAPVNVNITTQRATDVLAVPINALLALAEGGDAVEVVAPDGTHHLVGVQTGLYSSTMVAISGPGITAGTEVQVPSS